jgi:dynein heavy chain 2
MPSGERIQFGANVHFLFETDDLSNASPATISRMGMILVSEQDMDIKAMIGSWIAANSAEHMQTWIDDHLERCLKWISDRNTPLLDISATATARNALAQLHNCSSLTQFLVAVYRGLAANLPDSLRSEFAQEVCDHLLF